MIPHLLDLVAEGVPPAVLAEHQVGLAEPHRFRPHDFIGGVVHEHAVLVDAGFVGEGVLADNRLVALHLDAGHIGHQSAGGVEPLGVDSRVELEVVAACPDRHDHFLQRAVAGPLPDAVDGAFHLPGSLLQGSQTVGDGEAQVIMAMNADHDLVDVSHVPPEMSDQTSVLSRHCVAYCVGDVDGGGAGFNCFLHHLRQEVRLGARRVLGGELYIVAIVPCALDSFDGPSQDLLFGHAELKFAVNGAGGEEYMDALPRCISERFPGAVDVCPLAAGEAANDRPFNFPGHRADRLQLARRRVRKTRFDDVNAQVLEGMSDLELLRQVHAGAGRLLAVPQRSVEKHYSIGRLIGHLLLSSAKKE